MVFQTVHPDALRRTGADGYVKLASIVFSPEIDWQNQVLACMHRIYDLSLSQPSAFEMEIQELLLSI